VITGGDESADIGREPGPDRRFALRLAGD